MIPVLLPYPRFQGLCSFHIWLWAAPVSKSGLLPTLAASGYTLVKVTHLVDCPTYRHTLNNRVTSSELSSTSEGSSCLSHYLLGPCIVLQCFNFIPKLVCRKGCKMPYTLVWEFCTCILLPRQPQMTCGRGQIHSHHQLCSLYYFCQTVKDHR